MDYLVTLSVQISPLWALDHLVDWPPSKLWLQESLNLEQRLLGLEDVCKIANCGFLGQWSCHRCFENCLLFLHVFAFFCLCNTWMEFCSCERNNNRDGLKTPVVRTFD